MITVAHCRSVCSAALIVTQDRAELRAQRAAAARERAYLKSGKGAGTIRARVMRKEGLLGGLAEGFEKRIVSPSPPPERIVAGGKRVRFAKDGTKGGKRGKGKKKDGGEQAASSSEDARAFEEFKKERVHLMSLMDDS